MKNFIIASLLKMAIMNNSYEEGTLNKGVPSFLYDVGVFMTI